MESELNKDIEDLKVELSRAVNKVIRKHEYFDFSIKIKVCSTLPSKYKWSEVIIKLHKDFD